MFLEMEDDSLREGSRSQVDEVVSLQNEALEGQ